MAGTWELRITKFRNVITRGREHPLPSRTGLGSDLLGQSVSLDGRGDGAALYM